MIFQLKSVSAGRCDLVYLLSTLPPLDKPGSVPPISCLDLLNDVSGAQRESALLTRVFLGEDILLRQEYQFGQGCEPSLIVLTEGQLKNREPLPYGLPSYPQGGGQTRVTENELWRAYFKCVARGGQDYDCRILSDWVMFEVGLRNALAAERGRLMGRDPAQCVIDFPGGRAVEEYHELVENFQRAPNPLAGARFIEQARWAWLDRHDLRYAFDVNELVAYALRLVILNRCRHFSGPKGGMA